MIRFIESGFEKTTSIGHIRNGVCSYPFHPTVCGIGYIGVGNYISRDKNNIKQKAYEKWEGILNRITRNSGYFGKVFICDEWKNFQVFAKWHEENYIDNCELDKDIFGDGSLYSPETCCYVPEEINSEFRFKNEFRNNKLPIGVRKNGNCIYSVFKQEYLGSTESIEEAFLLYKNRKEFEIKLLAEKYKNIISKSTYDRLYKYEISIDM